MTGRERVLIDKAKKIIQTYNKLWFNFTLECTNGKKLKELLLTKNRLHKKIEYLKITFVSL